MRFLGIAVMASAAIVLGACGGGDKAATDTTAGATEPPELPGPEPPPP